MTIDELEPAAPELRELLEAERDVPALPREVSERLADRLSHTLGLPPLPTPPSAPPPSAAASSIAPAAKSAGIAAAGIARVLPFALTFAAGGLTGALAVTLALDARAPTVSNAPAVSSAPALSPARSPAPVPTPAPALSPAPAPASAPALSPTDPPRPAPPHDPSRDLGDSDLGAERQLLELAHNALARGRADEALGALERHARRFPKGRLAEERESMRVPTLVVLGRGAEARRAAERFSARYPRSLFAPVVQRAVEAIP